LELFSTGMHAFMRGMYETSKMRNTRQKLTRP
jgi:hypothetical protein